MGALAGFSYYFARQALSASAEETAQSAGQDYARPVQVFALGIVNFMQDMASTPQIYEASDRRQLIATMADGVNAAAKWFEGLGRDVSSTGKSATG